MQPHIYPSTGKTHTETQTETDGDTHTHTKSHAGGLTHMQRGEKNHVYFVLPPLPWRSDILRGHGRIGAAGTRIGSEEHDSVWRESKGRTERKSWGEVCVKLANRQ